jgi:hypothetical protein
VKAAGPNVQKSSSAPGLPFIHLPSSVSGFLTKNIKQAAHGNSKFSVFVGTVRCIMISKIFIDNEANIFHIF